MSQHTKGSDIASANNATIPLDGNYHDVTGTTQINTLSTTGVQAGSMITLQFDSTPTVKHQTTGTGAQFDLLGDSDFVAVAGYTLTLVYDGTFWKEIARTTVAGGGDVTKVGTPANNELAIWTGDGTLEGESDITYDSSAGSFISAKNHNGTTRTGS